MASFDATGRIGASASFLQAPLDLQIDLRGIAPPLQDPLRAQGIRLDAEGNARVTISGTATRPNVR